MRFATSPFGLLPNAVRAIFSGLVVVVTMAGTVQASDFVELGGLVNDIQIANFDGTGLPDLAVRMDSAVVLLVANGRGVYRTRLARATGPGGFAVGDVDGDGDSDVAVLDHRAREVEVIRTTPEGFSSEPVDTGGLIPVCAAIADVDADAIGDLIVLGRHPSESLNLVQVHLGRPVGTIRSTELRTNTSVVDVEIADVDVDGLLDLVVTTWFGSYGVFVFRGRGDGWFDPAVESAGEGLLYPHQIALGDLNGDHLMDLAIVGGLFDPYGRPNAAHVRFGNGTTRFDNWISYHDLVFDPGAVAVGDLDGDGNAEVVYSKYSELLIYRAGPGNTLGNPTNIPLEVSAGEVAIGDLDLDGAPDVAISHQTGLLILWNPELRPTAVTPTTWSEVRRKFR